MTTFESSQLRKQNCYKMSRFDIQDTRIQNINGSFKIDLNLCYLTYFCSCTALHLILK
jgi:hypothetical protein